MVHNSETERSRFIKSAGFIALTGNLFLSVIKFLCARISGSSAIMGDAIDSSSDVCIALLSIFISRVISKPEDGEHPWGHERAETTASMFLSFLIFYAGMQCIISAVSAIHKSSFPDEINIYAILAASVSIAGKLALCFILNILAKKSGSEIIKATAQNMGNDIMLSAGVLTGIATSRFLRLPVLDPLLGIVIGLWIIKNAFLLFKQCNMELMDGNTDKELYSRLFKAATSVKGVTNPHRARIRKMASRWDIDLDIEVDAGMSVHQAHELASRVENAIKNEIPDVFDIMVHIEPAGHQNHHKPEQFGLSQSDL